MNKTIEFIDNTNDLAGKEIANVEFIMHQSFKPHAKLGGAFDFAFIHLLGGSG